MNLLRVAAVVVVLGVAAEARAQWGWPSFGSHYSPSIYANETRIPYFALNPPVYYSYPVPRPYGYSPFAYPGWVPTPEFKPVEAPVVVNPFYNESPTEPVERLPSNRAVPTPTPAPRAGVKAKPTVERHDKVGVLPVRQLNPHFGASIAGRL